MASDIVPIQLSLTAGDLVTLWAPRWREDGEEWEAFLGDEDALFAFPEVAQLAAFVRTVPEHDLADHPAWSVVPDLTVPELTPEETRSYDVIGVPSLVADQPDTWTIGELAEITEMVRSVAEVCDLEDVLEVLGAAPGFGLLAQGALPFAGREGARLWGQLVETVAERWDEVVDALDQLVETPEVDAAALAAAEREVAVVDDAPPEVTEADRDVDADADADDQDRDTDEVGGFWEGVGIDPIRITTRDGSVVTLRCYLDDTPVFLGSAGRIDVFGSERALARWIAEDGADGHDLAAASTWSEVVEQAGVGELVVQVDDVNAYALTGLADDMAEGIEVVDPAQLELAVELLLDVDEWAGDDTARKALAESQSLGWMTSYITKPDPTRLAPSPPFTAEAARFRALEEGLSARLRAH